MKQMMLITDISNLALVNSNHQKCQGLVSLTLSINPLIIHIYF